MANKKKVEVREKQLAAQRTERNIRIIGLGVIILLVVAAVRSSARGADIELLGPVVFGSRSPCLPQQFVKSSGHKAAIGCATLGAITKLFTEDRSSWVSGASQRATTNSLGTTSQPCLVAAVAFWL